MIQSKLLLQHKGLIHFFFDRKDSVNLTFLGINKKNLIEGEQVHGHRVVFLKNNQPRFIKNCDGMITCRSVYLNIRTADCLPIFLYDPKNQIVAAIHAGWRGILSGIIENTIFKMVKLGSKPSDINVAAGPHIRKCCYQVPLERIHMFKKKYPDINLSKMKLSSWFMDLEKAVIFSLKEMGISESKIDAIPLCTCCEENYFSVRREGLTTGRMNNVVRLLNIT